MPEIGVNSRVFGLQDQFEKSRLGPQQRVRRGNHLVVGAPQPQAGVEAKGANAHVTEVVDYI
jgi:hypothetical protein